MPFGDGTGPLGLGRMTGRAAGYCAGFGVPGFANRLPVRPYPYWYGGFAPAWSRWGWGAGCGWWGRSFGRGWWKFRPYWYPWW